MVLLKCIDSSVLAFLKCMSGSVLALLIPYCPSEICIGPPEMHRQRFLMYLVYYIRKALKNLFEIEWVNPSKRGGMGGVFRGLAGLLQEFSRGISRGRSPREIPRSSPASPRKTPSILTLLLGFTLYLK